MIVSKRDLQFNYLHVDNITLKNIIDNIDKYYSHFSEPKLNKDGSQKIKNGILQSRPFHSPNPTLRNIQKSILKNILEKILLPIYVTGGIKKRSSNLNSALHKGKKYKFQTDLSNFFPSISSNMVYQMFRSYKFSHEVAEILTQLTTLKAPEAIRERCLPQGTSTSPYIANLVFHYIDLKLMSIINERKLTYTRYIDDLTFSSSLCFQNVIPDIIRIINEHGFKISRKKTTYKCGRTIITGIDVGNNTLRPTQEFIDKGKYPLSEEQKKGRMLFIKDVNKFSMTKTKSLIKKISTNN